MVAFESTTQTPLLRAYGEVLSHRTLEVRAPVAGTVVALAPEFRTGGRVAAGQLLVQIDPVPAEAELAVAEADLAEAAADLRDARRSLALTREDLAVAEEQAGLRQSALAVRTGWPVAGSAPGRRSKRRRWRRRRRARRWWRANRHWVLPRPASTRARPG